MTDVAKCGRCGSQVLETKHPAPKVVLMKCTECGNIQSTVNGRPGVHTEDLVGDKRRILVE